MRPAYNSSTENLQQLRQLTKKLTFSEMIHPEKEFSRIDTEAGTMLTFGLFKNHDVAIARSFASKGTVMSFHVHDKSREFVGVYQGHMVLKKEKETIDVTVGNIAVIEADETHSVSFPEDSWFWVVTMPADESFPEPK